MLQQTTTTTTMRMETPTECVVIDLNIRVATILIPGTITGVGHAVVAILATHATIAAVARVLRQIQTPPRPMMAKRSQRQMGQMGQMRHKSLKNRNVMVTELPEVPFR